MSTPAEIDDFYRSHGFTIRPRSGPETQSKLEPSEHVSPRLSKLRYARRLPVLAIINIPIGLFLGYTARWLLTAF